MYGEKIENVGIGTISNDAVNLGQVTLSIENVIENNNKSYSFSIPADAIDSDEKPEFLTITVTVTNSYGIAYAAENNVACRGKEILLPWRRNTGATRFER
jgi:hypothetical protein